MPTSTMRVEYEIQSFRPRNRKVPGRPMQEQKHSLNYFSSPQQKPKGLPHKEQRYRQTPRKGLSKALPSLPQPRAPPVSPASLGPPSFKIKGSHGKARRISRIHTVYTSKRQRKENTKTSQEMRKPDSNPRNEIQYAGSLAMKGLERTIGPQKPPIITEVRMTENPELQNSSAHPALRNRHQYNPSMATPSLSTHPALRNRHQHSPSMPAPYISTHPALRNQHQHSSSVPNTSSVVFQLRAGSSSIEMVQPSSLACESTTKPSATARDLFSHHSKLIQRSCEPSAKPVLECFSDDDGYSSTLCSPLETPRYNEEFHPSFQPALTDSSRSCYSTYTERSGIESKTTSISDINTNLHKKEAPRGILTTGEEVIDLYLAGFVDDGLKKEHHTLEPPITTGNENRSPREIAEVAPKIMGTGLLPPTRPFSFGSKSLPILGKAFQDVPPTPPPLQAPTATRDQYGFLKASHNITNLQYDVWNVEYNLNLEKRSMRWFSYMKEEDLPTHAPFRFPHRCAKTERFIRKGIPPMWRGAAWFWYAGGDQLLQRDPDLYSTLVSCSDFALNNKDKDIIERDLHRTFPDNVHFKPDVLSHEFVLHPPTEAPLLSALRRVLRAFALYCPRIGYCQSLNYIAGLLLLFLSEEKTFWMLRIITTEYLPGTHDLSLEGANVDLWILMAALKESMPGLWSKIGVGDEGTSNQGTGSPPIGLCTTSWFMSLFIGTLPIESVLRVWDVIFYEGSRTIFRVALAIFKLGEQRIKHMNDPLEIFQAVKALPRGMLDANSLMKMTCRRSGLSGAWVDKKRIERKKFYARARAKAAGIPIARDDSDQSPTTSIRTKADSVWKRSIGHRINL